MEYKFYSAKYDRAFKETFLKEENTGLLGDILEEALGFIINNIKLKPTEQLSSNIHISEKRLDALLDTNEGKIDVEVNSVFEDYVHPRNMSYLCNIYASHTLVGGEYNEDTMIMQVNFTYSMSKKEVPRRTYYVQDKSGEKFVKNIKVVEINMDYYLNLWYDFKKKGINKDLIEKHQLLIMLGLDLEELEELSKNYKKVGKYMDEIIIVNETPEFKNYMTEEEDKKKIFNSRMRYAREKGLKQGLEEGMKQGIEQGIEQEKIEVLKRLISKKIDAQTISEITGFSIEEINNYKKD